MWLSSVQDFCDELDNYLRVPFQYDIVTGEGESLLETLQKACEFCYIIGGFSQVSRIQL